MLNVGHHLQARGYRVTELGVDGNGNLHLDELRAALKDDTALVSGRTELGSEKTRDVLRITTRRFGDMRECARLVDGRGSRRVVLQYPLPNAGVALAP